MLWSRKEKMLSTHILTQLKRKQAYHLPKREKQTVCETITQISAMCVTKPMCVKLFSDQSSV